MGAVELSTSMAGSICCDLRRHDQAHEQAPWSKLTGFVSSV